MNSRMKYVVALVIFVVMAGGTAGIGAILHALSDYQPVTASQATPSSGTSTSSTVSGVSKHVYLTIQAFPQSPDALPAWEAEHNYSLKRNHAIPIIDPHLNWVTYGPSSNLVVPANSEVTMTIQNYDGGSILLNDFYTNVRGTIGNTMTVDGKTVSKVLASDVSHTFTIHGIPSNTQPWLFVNIPLTQEPEKIEAAGADNGLPPNPVNTTFSFTVGGPGQYVWQCEYPCGTYFDSFGGPMSTNGYMNGTFTVVASS